ncbi:MAG TPA: mannose-1-phosphate guanylyltransferase/mannose-6-phosphate isomerase [Candidatus Binatia bacterium]|jgi:mannose-1-phosphate guanylyltransferase/mannose-6-phosphate isomerase|nr:mannose-1-phosphate guanylyltransferase/mannose-6-phosphate isomerase [Candidatus Binatia bacterium]
MLHAVILAGGGGTRLWPLSRIQYPKQFLPLLGQHTLLQQTILRLDETVPPQRLWIVTGSEQAPLVQTQLSALPGLSGGAAQVLSEPVGRNTAAAIGLAAVHLQRCDPEAIMAVLPADHWIDRQSTFLTLLQSAMRLAEQEKLVTFGIVPDRAETGYGYIQRGEPSLAAQGHQPDSTVYCVEQFVEKPDLPTAQAYVSSGDYYWNAGIFLWRASTILEEIAAHLPALYAGLTEIADTLNTHNAEATLAAVYQRLESVSIDYGVLEKSARLLVVPADIGWSDLGEWTAIHRLSSQDERGNTLSSNVLDLGSENSFVYGSRRPIATIGLKDMVVVDAEDALLVCSHERIQEVKTVVQRLQTQDAEVVHTPRTVQRPWGTYTVLEERAGCKVKCIIVHPGASLSLQLHHHRSEHWVVVRGVAQVTNGEQEFLLSANQATYIPMATKHRLANPGPEPLEIIEVQTGTYLGEDDIVRFADLYGRVLLTPKA